MKPHTITTRRWTCWTGPGRLLAAFFSLAAVLLCNSAPLAASEPVVEKEEDAVITSLVKESLLFHLLLSCRTDTIDGMVTLSGNAENVAERELGTSLASGVTGVKGVINRMVVPTILAGNGR
jgi:hypothetical protein